MEKKTVFKAFCLQPTGMPSLTTPPTHTHIYTHTQAHTFACCVGDRGLQPWLQVSGRLSHSWPGSDLVSSLAWCCVCVCALQGRLCVKVCSDCVSFFGIDKKDPFFLLLSALRCGVLLGVLRRFHGHSVARFGTDWCATAKRVCV